MRILSLEALGGRGLSATILLSGVRSHAEVRASCGVSVLRAPVFGFTFRVLAALGFWLFFALGVQGALFASWSLEPVGPDGVSFYPFEFGTARFLVENPGLQPLGPVSVQFRSSDNIVFLRGAEAVPVYSVDLESIGPRERLTLPVFFIVQSGDANYVPLKAFFSLDRGASWGSVEEPLVRRPSPLGVDVRLEQPAWNLDKGSVTLSFVNASDGPVSNVSAELGLVSGVQSLSSAVRSDFLPAGASLENQVLRFEYVSAIERRAPVWVQVSFDDGRGRHALWFLAQSPDGNFARPRQPFADWVWVLLVLVVLAGYYVWRSRSESEFGMGESGHGGSHSSGMGSRAHSRSIHDSGHAKASIHGSDKGHSGHGGSHGGGHADHRSRASGGHGDSVSDRSKKSHARSHGDSHGGH